jgi:hypothetical protein
MIGYNGKFSTMDAGTDITSLGWNIIHSEKLYYDISL